MAHCQLEQIELLVLDVDGVLTAGEVILTDAGNMIYQFCTQDGSGIKYWHRCGGKTAIITGRESKAVLIRAQQLGIQYVYQAALKKIEAYRRCLAETGVDPAAVCYVGDDLPDLPPMRYCGYPVAVANAVEPIKEAAAFVTARSGGQGAVREVIERILQAQGKWSGILEGYRDQKL
ncbi:MAG: HAD hydrolase family protein [Phycisphaerae bacterium]|nr:HAD hydrolase family protein [Phycisphaerae bacterium]